MDDGDADAPRVHRLAAYDTAKWVGLIPAMAFGGTLNEAYLIGASVVAIE
jgi:hypothetical protein